MKYATVHGFEQFSQQRVFDTAAGHLLTQGGKSTDGRQCCYRGAGGRKCAAGVFLRDDAAERCEGYSWRDLVGLYMVPAQHIHLVSRLQALHDADLPHRWPAQLRAIAKAFGLQSVIVDQFEERAKASRCTALVPV